jgi:hypothetical protein
MESENQPIKNIDLGIDKFVKRFGNFCGPGWSAGREDSNISPKEILEGAVFRLYKKSLR